MSAPPCPLIKAFYHQTVLPLVSHLCRAWTAWLAPAFGEGLAIERDIDGLPVFADERASAWARIENSSVYKTRPGSEFSKIQKWGDRHFRIPKWFVDQYRA